MVAARNGGRKWQTSVSKTAMPKNQRTPFFLGQKTTYLAQNLFKTAKQRQMVATLHMQLELPGSKSPP